MIPGGSLAGCVHSCCGVDAIEETLQLVMWGREVLDGKLYASFGIHPNCFEQYSAEVEARLVAALRECGSQGVAWGECGLDYCKRILDLEKDPSMKDRMHKVFAQQARVAVRLGMPLVVHSRDAVEDTLAILRENVPSEHPVHLHSYMGMPDAMLEFLEEWSQGYVGIAGCITWPIADREMGGLADVVRALPLDRLLLESDGPFMAPYPHKGEESHPGLMPWVAAGVAKIKGLEVGEVLAAAQKNFHRMFRLPLG